MAKGRTIKAMMASFQSGRRYTKIRPMIVKASLRIAVKASDTAAWTRLMSFVMREMIRPVGFLSKKDRGCTLEAFEDEVPDIRDDFLPHEAHEVCLEVIEDALCEK